MSTVKQRTHRILTRGARRKGGPGGRRARLREWESAPSLGPTEEISAPGGIAAEGANSPSKKWAGQLPAANARAGPKCRAVDVLARTTQYGLVAPPETLMSAKIQQQRWVTPSRLGDRVMQVGTREAYIGQHVVAKTGQQLDIAPMLPNDHQPFRPTHEARALHALSPRPSHRHRALSDWKLARRVPLTCRAVASSSSF